MRIFLQWFGLDTFTIQENSHFLYPLFSLCIPILKSQVQLVVKSQKNHFIYCGINYFVLYRSNNFPYSELDL
ncbi:hypothetical protein ETC02_17350 [Geobacillus sp. DSP4a]|nr:hypothetical protein [Geobacillus sp. DSP4a]